MIARLKDIWYAVTSPEKYRDFMNCKRSNVLIHTLLLVLAGSILTLGFPILRFVADGGYERLFEESIPNFTVSAEEGFWIEEPIEIDEYNFLIKADSNVVREDITDIDGQYGVYDFVVIIDKEQLHISASGTQDITARFAEVPGLSISKQDIMDYIPVVYMITFWIFILALLVDFGYYFMMAVVISWLSRIIAGMMKVRLNNRKMFQMAVYAGTLSYILLLIQSVTGMYIPNYTMFSYVITLGYMFFALKEYKETGIEELPPDIPGGREDKI